LMVEFCVYSVRRPAAQPGKEEEGQCLVGMGGGGGGGGVVESRFNTVMIVQLYTYMS